jgi:hypothetical protein
MISPERPPRAYGGGQRRRSEPGPRDGLGERAHPDDPNAAKFREMLDEARRSHLGTSRRDLGWGVFVLRQA